MSCARLFSQLQCYLDLRRHAQNFHIHFVAQIDLLQGGAKDDLCRKASTLVTFDFEAAVRLKAWEDAGRIVRVSQPGLQYLSLSSDV